MRIVFGCSIPSGMEALLIHDNVVYRPDFPQRSVQAQAAALVNLNPDVLVVRALPDPSVLRSWRNATQLRRELSLVLIGALQRDAAEPEPDGITLRIIDSQGTAEPEIAALLAAEDDHVRRLAAEFQAARRAARPCLEGKEIALVGGGIVNLVTAYALAREGYRVTLFDGGPDPVIAADWHRHGCTFGGGDARIFSLNESRHHHHKGHVVTADTNTQFWRDLSQDGWLAIPADAFAHSDFRWVHAFERVPQWLSGRYDKDIVSFNCDSLMLWQSMMREAPEIFEPAFLRMGLLRLYATEQKYHRARRVECAIGSVVREIMPSDLAAEFPSLAESVQAGFVTGALEVSGFSLNVQKFGLALMRWLKAQGANLAWDTKVEQVERDRFGRVTGLRLASGDVVTAQHYVLSPGASGNGLLAGFRSENKIASVVGMWMMLPDDSPRLERPLKISRTGFASAGAAEGANVIAGTDAQGRPIINVSSGHGYIGVNPGNPAVWQLAELARAVDETAQQYFPTKYRLAKAYGLNATGHRYCIRPWTPSGLGLFEIADTAHGGILVITGGHNTGGFAQSPSVAQAVVAALRGTAHPMHVLYHPDRFTDFIATDADAPAIARAS